MLARRRRSCSRSTREGAPAGAACGGRPAPMPCWQKVRIWPVPVLGCGGHRAGGAGDVGHVHMRMAWGLSVAAHLWWPSQSSG